MMNYSNAKMAIFSVDMDTVKCPCCGEELTYPKIEELDLRSGQAYAIVKGNCYSEGCSEEQWATVEFNF